MDTRLTTTYGIWRSLIAATVALALLMTLGATSASAASPTACRVQNTDTGKTYAALQAAVDAASRGTGSRSGGCHRWHGHRQGPRHRGRRDPDLGQAVLDGDTSTRVLLVEKGVQVRLRSLVIRDGNAPYPALDLRSGAAGVDGDMNCGRMGGGIHNWGTWPSAMSWCARTAPGRRVVASTMAAASS